MNRGNMCFGWVLICVSGVAAANDRLQEVLLDGDADALRQLLVEHPDWVEKRQAEIPSYPTPLHLSAVRGQTQLVQILLDAGAKVDSLNEEHETPLFAAAMAGHANVVEMLLKAGAQVNHQGRGIHGATALDHAARNGHKQVVALLLDHGADANGERALERSIESSAATGEFSTARLLLDRGADPNRGYAMFSAAAHAPVELLRRMLELGGDPNGQAFYGDVLARAADNLDNTKLLVEHGADVNGSLQNGYRPLHRAAEIGNVQTVEFLISQGADVNVVKSDGARPVDLAVARGHTAVVALLLAKGATPNFTTFVATGNVAEVKRLLKQQPALRDQPLPGESQPQPIHVAVLCRQPRVLERLLEAGANPNATRGDESALHLAVWRDELPAVKILLKFRADPNARLSAHRYGSGNRTPLHFAIGGPLGVELSKAESRPVNLEIVKELLEHGADVQAKSELGTTPLDEARQTGNSALLQLLQERPSEQGR